MSLGKDTYESCSSVSNSDYGLQRTVTQAQCKGAGDHIGYTATATGSVEPSLKSVKFKEDHAVYYAIYLAYCGGGVYVKVIGTDQFVVFY